MSTAMQAAATGSVVEAGPAAPPAVVDERQVRAERVFWHRAIVGSVVGMFVGAGLWVLLVSLALVGAGWPLRGPLLMAVAVGVFAGSFLGGWAGVMAGCGVLERAEHEQRHPPEG